MQMTNFPSCTDLLPVPDRFSTTPCPRLKTGMIKNFTCVILLLVYCSKRRAHKIIISYIFLEVFSDIFMPPDFSLPDNISSFESGALYQCKQMGGSQ